MRRCELLLAVGYCQLAVSLNDGAVVAVDGSSQGYDDASDTSIDSTEGILYLWQHATTDGAVSFVVFEVGMSDGGYHTVVVIRIAEYPFLFE